MGLFNKRPASPDPGKRVTLLDRNGQKVKEWPRVKDYEFWENYVILDLFDDKCVRISLNALCVVIEDN